MIRCAAILLSLISVTVSLDCNGPADIVIAVPGSTETVNSTEFANIESFLHGVVSYFDITAARVGLVLYGRDAVVVSDLDDAITVASLNARVTLLSQRDIFQAKISGGQNVPKAISKVHEMLNSGRDGVPKIGVIMTYGREDLTSSDAQTVMTQVSEVASEALEDGVQLFATNTGGGLPGFMNITMDTCRLFSLGSYSGLPVLLPYLASSLCYVLDKEVEVTTSNCFPEIMPPPPRATYRCRGYDINRYLPDPYNCAKFYWCPYGRYTCAPGNWYDPIAKSCNHYEFTTCYSGLTCPKPFGLFSHPRMCSKFLNCYNKIPRVLNCPEHTLFNPEKGYCDFKTNVHCEDK